MNPYWILFCLFLLASSFFGGWEVRSWKDGQADAKHDEAQQQVTITAQQHVIKRVQAQDTINQKAETNYEKDADAISTLYDTSVQPTAAATGGSVRPIPAPSCGTETSKKYKLTPQQCDQEEAKCNALWNWTQRQAAVK